MTKPKIGFETAFRNLAEAARRQAAEPSLTPDELSAYLDGELSPEEEERLQNRLVLDAEAVEAVLDLMDPARLDSAEETDAPVPAWESIRARLEQPEDTELPARPAQRSRAHTARRSPLSFLTGGHWWAVAALLLLAFGLGIWVERLRRADYSGGPAPRINVFHWELLPVDASLPRAAGTEEEVTAAPDTPQLLVLHLGDRGAYSEYHLEIRDAEGDVYWQTSGLEPSPIGTFNVELPPDFLPLGRYELRLYGGKGEAAELLATYRLQIRRP